MTNINWGFMTRLSNDNNSRGDRKKSSKQLSYTKHCQIQTSSLFQINSSTSSLIYPSSIHVYKNMHTQHKRCFISLFITHNTKVLHQFVYHIQHKGASLVCLSQTTQRCFISLFITHNTKVLHQFVYHTQHKGASLVCLSHTTQRCFMSTFVRHKTCFLLRK